MFSNQFDPVLANQDAEREWYSRCAAKGLWKPLREEQNEFHRRYIEEIGRIYSALRKLAVAVACNLIFSIILIIFLVKFAAMQ